MPVLNHSRLCYESSFPQCTTLESILIWCAKRQIFGTPNTKKPLSWDILNTIIFGTYEQYCFIFETVQIEMLKKKIFIFSLESPPLPYLLSVSLPFFLFFLLQNLHLFLFLFFFFPSLSLSLSLSLLFSPPRSLPLRSIVIVEFGLTDEVDWWRSHVSLAGFFFFFGLWIPCDCGWWWSWVDSMWFGLYKWNWFISSFFFFFF